MKKLSCLALLFLSLYAFARDITYDLNRIVSITVSDAYELRQDDDLYTHILNDSLKYVSKAEMVFQQKSLSKLSKAAMEQYSRILLKYIEAGEEDFPYADDDNFTEADLSFFAEQVQDELAPGNTILEGPFVSVPTTKSGAKYIKVHYIRSGLNGSVTANLCFFFNRAYALRAVFSHRTSEANIWEAKLDSALNSITWSTPYFIPKEDFLDEKKGETTNSSQLILIIVCVFVFVIIVYLLSKHKKHKELDQSTKQPRTSGKNQPIQPSTAAAMMESAKTIATQSQKNGFYWSDFKTRKPSQAKEISALIGRDLSKVSDIDAFQIVTTILRWSENAECPIHELKENFWKDFENIYDAMEYEQLVEMLKEKRKEEAANFSISPDNTITAFMLQWVQEKHEDKRGEDILNHILDNLGVEGEERERMYNSIQKTVQTLPPDISHQDREENRLIRLAEEGVDFISDHYKKLNNSGRIEALIYCTTCLIDLPTDYDNELDLDKKEDRYFLLLHDKIICPEIDNTANFINSRIEFYNDQKRKLAQNTRYTPMFIHNAFYENPLCDQPDNLSDSVVSPIELLQMSLVLKELEAMFQERLHAGI